jgi:shikimate dehydrogenase
MTVHPRFLAGLIGAGIQPSKSPALHTDEAREHGLECTYELLDVDRFKEGEAALPRLLDEAEQRGFAGVNITHPCKQAVIPLLTSLSADATALGAVNTVIFQDGARIGYNTDWLGFSESLTRGLPNADLHHVLIAGAGGAGAAIAYALLRGSAERVAIFDTESERADGLAEKMQTIFPRACVRSTPTVDIVGECTGLVNCSPVGMERYPGAPVPVEFLQKDQWVADIVYFPIETVLLKAARARGCATLDGGGMVVFQAAEAFRLFTGLQPDHDRMLRRFRGYTGKGAAVV